MWLVNSKQKVVALPVIEGKDGPAAGYVDVVIEGKPNNVLRVKKTNLTDKEPK